MNEKNKQPPHNHEGKEFKPNLSDRIKRFLGSHALSHDDIRSLNRVEADTKLTEFQRGAQVWGVTTDAYDEKFLISADRLNNTPEHGYTVVSYEPAQKTPTCVKKHLVIKDNSQDDVARELTPPTYLLVHEGQRDESGAAGYYYQGKTDVMSELGARIDSDGLVAMDEGTEIAKVEPVGLVQAEPGTPDPSEYAIDGPEEHYRRLVDLAEANIKY